MLFRLVRQFAGRYRKWLSIVVVATFVQTIAALYLPTLNADIIDNGVVKGDTGYIMSTGGVMLTVALGQIVAAITAVYFGSRTATAIGRDIRKALFERVQSFSAREVGQFGAPSLVVRSTNDVQQVQMLVLMTLTMMLMAPIMGVGAVILSLRQNVRLSGLLLVIVPVLGIVVTLIARRMRPLFRLVQERLDGINRIMREQITGVRVVRAFVRDEPETERFRGGNTALFDVSLGAGKLMGMMFPVVLSVINLSSVAVLWFGGHLINDGTMQVGALTAFLSYLLQVMMAVMMSTFMLMMIPRAEVCADRIQEVLSTETSVAPPLDPVAELSMHGHLDLVNVGFRYPGAEEPVLSGISISAGPGQVTAIIGSTGSGKTTLLNLIPRLTDATEGAVMVGGVDVRELAPETLAKAVGIVPQKPYLFSGTIASNLRYGNPDATDDELWQALLTAQADFVSDLDAPISQGGTNVSGGQRQRLAIARALVHKPDIYLFDDSFSALDYATDARLRAALARETQEATVVIVAQRVATIRNADHIIVLDDGRVVGTGTHAELLASSETYREIVLSQMTEQEAA
ncbi:MAG TPA: ABC transporter ATP-binding protein [Streptosporangiaceae bacterium]|nr:ABC transporter ATP-binding protein [Streptosporangiaceae bacterium]